MNVAMMDPICAECERRRASWERAGRHEGQGVARAATFERRFSEEWQIEQIERSFGRDWKW
jgi:hypothetical protein